MKKKLMMVAVLLGALSLGACVDDNESQSVTDVRNAKAEQLKSIAAMNNAEAQAKLIYAEAEAAFKAQETALKKAQAEKAAAEAEITKLQAQMESAAYDAELAVRLAQAEKNKADAEAQLAVITGNAEKYQLDLQAKIADLQKALLKAQIDLTKEQDNAANAEMQRLETLAKNYSTLLYSFTEEKYLLAGLQTALVKAKADSTDWQAKKKIAVANNTKAIAAIDEQIAFYQKYTNYTEDIADLKNQIDVKKREQAQAEDHATALENAHDNMKLDLKPTTAMLAAIDELDIMNLENYNYTDANEDPAEQLGTTIFDGNFSFSTYVPVTLNRNLKGTILNDKDEAFAYKYDSLGLEIKYKDSRKFKVAIDQFIAGLDIKGQKEAIDKASTGLKALYDAAVKAAEAAKKAYEADPTKANDYNNAVDAENVAKANYEKAVKILEHSEATVKQLNDSYALISDTKYGDELKKSVDEYNAAMLTLYTPKAAAYYDYLVAKEAADKIKAEYDAMWLAYNGIAGTTTTYMTVADYYQWYIEQYLNNGYIVNSGGSFHYWDVDNERYEVVWLNGMQLSDMYIKQVQSAADPSSAYSIAEAIEALEASKEQLEEANANYAQVDTYAKNIVLKEKEIEGKSAVVDVLEIQMNKAKATLDAAIAAATK